MYLGRPMPFMTTTTRPLLGITACSVALAMIFVAFTAASTQRQPAANEPSPVTVPLPAQPADRGFAGEDSCRSCHRAELTEFRKTGHARVSNADSTQRMNCESCHGPGKAHADAQEAAHGDDAAGAAANRLIFAFKGTTAENSSRCLTCHSAAAQLNKFDHSRHAATGVPCQSCHSAHLVEAADASAPRRPPLAQAQFFQVPQMPDEQRWLRESLLKDSQPALCYSCHQQARAQFAQPFHHHVPERSMK